MTFRLKPPRLTRNPLNFLALPRPPPPPCASQVSNSGLGMALIPTYARIGIAAPLLALVARMVQGFSLGGEIGSNTAYLLESSPVGRRGLVLSFQSAFQNLALVAGGSVGVLLTAILPPAALDAYGWRIAFLGSIEI